MSRISENASIKSVKEKNRSQSAVDAANLRANRAGKKTTTLFGDNHQNVLSPPTPTSIRGKLYIDNNDENIKLYIIQILKLLLCRTFFQRLKHSRE